jgi:hypothetical protein
MEPGLFDGRKHRSCAALMLVRMVSGGTKDGTSALQNAFRFGRRQR